MFYKKTGGERGKKKEPIAKELFEKEKESKISLSLKNNSKKKKEIKKTFSSFSQRNTFGFKESNFNSIGKDSIDVKGKLTPSFMDLDNSGEKGLNSRFHCLEVGKSTNRRTLPK